MSYGKDCFGILEEVFPIGKGGLREVVPRCMECEKKVECLRTALDTQEGLALKGEVVDRAADTGLIGRIRRWSEKKDLDRRIKSQKKEKSE
jgi:hypothetical protein